MQNDSWIDMIEKWQRLLWVLQFLMTTGSQCMVDKSIGILIHYGVEENMELPLFWENNQVCLWGIFVHPSRTFIFSLMGLLHPKTIKHAFMDLVLCTRAQKLFKQSWEEKQRSKISCFDEEIKTRLNQCVVFTVQCTPRF